MEISKEIEGFSPANGEWLKLDELISNIKNMTEKEISACLGVFERFPNENGAGVFFSIIHSLEHFGGYESLLAESVIKKPNEWNLLMLNRMLNADIDMAGNFTIFELLTNVINNESLSSQLRETAQEYLG